VDNLSLVVVVDQHPRLVLGPWVLEGSKALQVVVVVMAAINKKSHAISEQPASSKILASSHILINRLLFMRNTKTPHCNLKVGPLTSHAISWLKESAKKLNATSSTNSRSVKSVLP
jgi:hypothetical protein